MSSDGGAETGYDHRTFVSEKATPNIWRMSRNDVKNTPREVGPGKHGVSLWFPTCGKTHDRSKYGPANGIPADFYRLVWPSNFAAEEEYDSGTLLALRNFFFRELQRKSTTDCGETYLVCAPGTYPTLPRLTISELVKLFLLYFPGNPSRPIVYCK